ncbi:MULTISPECIES: hypothetical protein [unclassified Leclercia]|uniref:C-type lysozyme inhibitor domain-containing protein n=1 Tax=Leclercia barmai TaxID=2785629 RepID=A0ABS7RZ37_9ENTR|nr:MULTISPECIES: hypothetical protein [unclassified Leclercia]MBZ0059579.1 hypothetical protein [Leclercia sp. EMC7]MCM5697289.1 hypothetical protein [Leclercia sp. LTM01]MCM5702116.1 hypothetical protein [Leclercia sp. LTM14]
MRTKAIIAATILTAASTATATPIATSYLCNDGTFVHISEQNGRLNITWRGESYPITQIETMIDGARLMGGTPGKIAVDFTPPWLDGDTTATATIDVSKVDSPSTSQDCRPDKQSRHMDL